MKSRIVESLYAFSQEECPKKHLSLRSILSEETGMSSEAIRHRSKDLLKSIIHNYAAFEVSTIDGFTHRVLRSFAKDLGLPLNFEVELQTDAVLQEAVERVIDRAGEDQKLTGILIGFALIKADEDKSWDIARDLYSIAELLVKEANQPFIELLKDKKLDDFQKLSAHLKVHLKTLQDEIQSLAVRFFDLLEENALEETDFNRKLCPGFFEKLRVREFGVKFGAAWQQKIADAPLYPQRTEKRKKQILDSLQPQIALLFLQAKKNIGILEFLMAVEKKLIPLSLLSVIQQEVEVIKKERSLVLISDFNATIARAVKDQPAPFIYERLGERYRNYFIDEFQDTSQLQWENLIPLIDHALKTQDEENQAGSLTIVGDAKQSIYRWRGGRAEQFMDLCKEKNPFNLENKEEVVVLPKNYRSTRTIVQFNNDFFKFASQSFSSAEHRQLFEKTSFQEPANEEEGYVNLSFVEAENVEEEMKVYPEKVLEIIQDLKSREVPMNNVCILTRTGKEGVAIANFLSERGIPIVSYESLLIARSPEVQFLSDLLAFSLDWKDSQLKLRLLQYLLDHQLKEEDQFSVIAERLQLNGQKFFDSLADFGFKFNLNRVTDYSVYEAVEYCIRSFNLSETSDAYVQFFLDFVYEVSQKETAGIPQLLEVWEQKKDRLSIVAPKSELAVQILTIHKAKGLEFPVVIYPFVNSTITDISRESLWLNLPEPIRETIPIGYIDASQKMQNWGEEAAGLYEELCCYSQLDTLNVLYVALTRPVQQLYVISKMELKKDGQENPNKISGLLIAFLKSEGRWNGGDSYSFGDISKFEADTKSTSTTRLQQSFHSSPTEGQGISIITKSGLLWDSVQEKAIEKGHLVHELFAGINVSSDVDKVLAEARAEGKFKLEDEPRIKASLMKVIQHPDLSEFFSGSYTNKNELDIISVSGVLRPDRLNFIGNQVSIIDYKTGAPLPAHQAQIDQYANVLSEMGYKVEKKILVYTNEEVEIISTWHKCSH